LFLLAFPIAIPLWLASIVLLAIAAAIAAILRPVQEFWTAPPKRMPHDWSYYGYGYGRSSKPDKLIPLKERDAA
jgi:hypothetical protein